ncbi:O-antigen ligase [Metabacillus crassostreae]|uniref:O-antigen polymerase n=1 Tax=Metabacillus crassostreae TaxID=929098 RepID=UPI0019598C70|nr:O-antigen polymerase [Metabacillus crassostreae]MBM7606287.1 O-antigen ligase [Metabacillus crassostreae]
MNIIRINSFILILYIYLVSISLLLAPFVSTFFVENLLLISLIFITLCINKFKVNVKIIMFFGFLILFVSINLLVVSYKQYVLGDGVNLILHSFIPIYLLSLKLISFSIFKKIWIKVSIIFTYILPVYYLYRQSGYISYFDIGFIAHLNILIMTYHLMSLKRRSYKMLFYLTINILVVAILGSRLVLISSLVTSLFTYLLLSNKKNAKFYFNISLISIIVLLIFQNLIAVLNYINNIILSLGLNSRNLSMFIAQLSGRYDNSTIVSGRDNIYPIIIEYLIDNGFFPSGFGVARTLTNGAYYHAHNFLLELLLIFGFFGLIIILYYFFVKIRILIKFKNFHENRIILDFLLLFLVSYMVRSLMGTYFVKDVIFLIFLAIIFSIKKEKIKN